jgi:hypothetical protein
MSEEVAMSTLTQETAHSSDSPTDSPHHPIVIAVLVIVFWLATAAFVITAHAALDPLSTYGSAAVTIAAIAGAAYAYTRWCAPYAGLPHALGAGIAWFALAVVTEIAVTEYLGHGWYRLLGSPHDALLRTTHFFVWIFAPALFARRELEA